MMLTVITPWRNHLELAQDYWAAIRVCDVEVIVIDNASDPRLPNAYRLEENFGFSAACNIGLELARTDAVLFLNNDISALKPDWDEPIREALEPGVLVGAQLRYDPHGSVGGEQLPYLDGWCLAGMREDLLKLGGFDEGYEEPAYFSDNDLSLRARVAGMTLREVSVGLIHKGGVTSGGGQNAHTREVTIRNQKRFNRLASEFLGAKVAA